MNHYFKYIDNWHEASVEPGNSNPFWQMKSQMVTP